MTTSTTVRCVEIDGYRLTPTGTPGAVDADVVVTFDDGSTETGEITVLPGDADPTTWGAWGDARNWASEELARLGSAVLDLIDAEVDSAECARVIDEARPRYASGALVEVGDWVVGGVGDGLDWGQVTAIPGSDDYQGRVEVAWRASETTTDALVDGLEAFTLRTVARDVYVARVERMGRVYEVDGVRFTWAELCDNDDDTIDELAAMAVGERRALGGQGTDEVERIR